MFGPCFVMQNRLIVLPSFAIISLRKRESWLLYLLLLCGYCSMSLSRDAVH